MKKLWINEILAVLLLVCIFGFSGCRKKSKEVKTENETSVETSENRKRESDEQATAKEDTKDSQKKESEKESETESEKAVDATEARNEAGQGNNADEAQPERPSRQVQTGENQQAVSQQNEVSQANAQARGQQQEKNYTQNEADVQQVSGGQTGQQQSGEQQSGGQQSQQQQSQQPQQQQSQQPQPQVQSQTGQTFRAYDPNEVCRLATDKCKASGMKCTVDYLSEMLKNGQITKQEYDMYYPYDGMGYLSVFVETDLNKAGTIASEPLESVNAIADYIAGMIKLERDSAFYIEYNGRADFGGEEFYEFRCCR